MKNSNLVILDRDGVINLDSKEYIKSPREWLPIESSLEAISLLNQHGYKVVVATNQSGLARGYYTHKTLSLIHEKMHNALLEYGAKIDHIFYCPHGPNEGCTCRKPKTGLLEQIKKFYGYNLKSVPFIGDSLRDLECAYAMGCLPILVKTGNGLQTQAKLSNVLKNTPVFDNLMAWAKYTIQKT